MSAGGIAWVEFDATGADRWMRLDFEASETALTAQTKLNKLIEKLQYSKASSVKVVVAPSLAHHWLQTPPLETASLSELHAVAQSRASFLFGNPDGGSWAVSAEWDAKHSFLCTCLASSWIPINAGTQPYRYPLIVTSPLALALSKFEKQLPLSGWLAIAVTDMLYIMHRSQGRLSSLRSVRDQAQATLEKTEVLAEREWRREMLRTQLFADELAWLYISPNRQQVAKSPSFRAIPWSTSSQFLPTDSPPRATSVSGNKTDEATAALWCALQLFQKDAQ